MTRVGREEAEAFLRGALDNQNEARAVLMEAEAAVLIARAQLLRAEPASAIEAEEQPLSHSALERAVLAVLARAGRPIKVDDIIQGLVDDSVPFAGEHARGNMLAYLSRWKSVKAVRRGHYVPA